MKYVKKIKMPPEEYEVFYWDGKPSKELNEFFEGRYHSISSIDGCMTTEIGMLILPNSCIIKDSNKNFESCATGKKFDEKFETVEDFYVKLKKILTEKL